MRSRTRSSKTGVEPENRQTEQGRASGERRGLEKALEEALGDKEKREVQLEANFKQAKDKNEATATAMDQQRGDNAAALSREKRTAHHCPCMMRCDHQRP